MALSGMVLAACGAAELPEAQGTPLGQQEAALCGMCGDGICKGSETRFRCPDDYGWACYVEPCQGPVGPLTSSENPWHLAGTTGAPGWPASGPPDLLL